MDTHSIGQSSGRGRPLALFGSSWPNRRGNSVDDYRYLGVEVDDALAISEQVDV
jgi:hypothetical protein